MSEEQLAPETPDNVQSYTPPDRIQHEGLQEHGTPEQLAELYGALAAAQGDFKDVRKSASVDFIGKTGRVRFDYAPLPEIDKATRPALKAHGLALTQPHTGFGGDLTLYTILAHKGGGRMVSWVRFTTGPEIKQQGAALTYMRRYAKNAVLGTAGDADADDIPDAGNDAVNSGRDQQPPPPPKQDKPRGKKQEPKKEAPPKQQAKPEQEPDRFPDGPENEEPAPDPEPEPSSEPQNSPDGPPTEDQQHAIRSLLVELQVGTSGAMSICKDVTGKGPRELTYADAGKLIEALQAKKKQG